MTVNRKHSRIGFFHKACATADTVALESRTEPGNLDFLLDNKSMEIFVDGGTLSMSYLLFPGVCLRDLLIEAHAPFNRISA